MNETSIPVKSQSEIVIKNVAGDLLLQGWRQDEIKIEGKNSDDIKQKGNQITLDLKGDCVLSLPHNLSISLGSVQGDIVVKDLGQALRIERVDGNVTLLNIMGATIQQISGDLTANQLQGDLIVNSLDGNGDISQVIGQIAVQTEGDLEIRKIGQGIDISAGGNITAAFDPLLWQAYSIQAGGDLEVSLPAQSSISADLKSKSERIILQYSGLDQEIFAPQHNLEVGDHGAALVLSAGGTLRVSNLSWKYRSVFDTSFYTFENLDQLIQDFSQETSQHLGKHISSLEKDLQNTLSGLADSLESSGLTEENLEKLKQRILETSQQAARKAKITAQKAEQRIQKNISQIQQKARDVREKNREFNLERFLFGEQEQHDSADEERLIILKMLEEQKISAVEAADLISALEKKS